MTNFKMENSLKYVRENLGDVDSDSLHALKKDIQDEITKRCNPSKYLEKVWKNQKSGRVVAFSFSYFKEYQMLCYNLRIGVGRDIEVFTSQVFDVLNTSYHRMRLKKSVAEIAISASRFFHQSVEYTPQKSPLDLPLGHGDEKHVEHDFDYDHETDDGEKISLPKRNWREDANLLAQLDRELDRGSRGEQQFHPLTADGKNFLKLGWTPVNWISWYLLSPEQREICHTNTYTIHEKFCYHCPCEKCSVKHPFTSEEMNDAEFDARDNPKPFLADVHEYEGEISSEDDLEYEDGDVLWGNTLSENKETKDEKSKTLVQKVVTSEISSDECEFPSHNIEMYILAAVYDASMKRKDLVCNAAKDLNVSEYRVGCMIDMLEDYLDESKKDVYISEKGESYLEQEMGGNPSPTDLERYMNNLRSSLFPRKWASQFIEDNLKQITLCMVEKYTQDEKFIAERICEMTKNLYGDEVPGLCEELESLENGRYINIDEQGNYHLTIKGKKKCDEYRDDYSHPLELFPRIKNYDKDGMIELERRCMSRADKYLMTLLEKKGISPSSSVFNELLNLGYIDTHGSTSITERGMMYMFANFRDARRIIVMKYIPYVVRYISSNHKGSPKDVIREEFGLEGIEFEEPGILRDWDDVEYIVNSLFDIADSFKLN
jgi:hypothetical protein